MKTTLKLAALAAAYLLPASAFGIQIRLVDEFPYTFDVYWGEMPQAPLEDRAILSSIDKANDFAYYFDGSPMISGPQKSRFPWWKSLKIKVDISKT